MLASDRLELTSNIKALGVLLTNTHCKATVLIQHMIFTRIVNVRKSFYQWDNVSYYSSGSKLKIPHVILHLHVYTCDPHDIVKLKVYQATSYGDWFTKFNDSRGFLLCSRIMLGATLAWNKQHTRIVQCNISTRSYSRICRNTLGQWTQLRYQLQLGHKLTFVGIWCMCWKQSFPLHA